MSSSIVTANRAGQLGGGISIEAGGVVLTDAIVAGNTAGQDGGGLYAVDSTVSRLGKTIFSHNQPDDCVGCQ